MKSLEEYKEYIEKFSNQRILIIGDLVLDHYVTGVVERLNPEADAPLMLVKEEHEMTGGAGNVAKNAAMLGAKTTLISVIGDDKGADQVKAAATKEGYTLITKADSSRPTIRKVRFMVDDRQLLRTDFEMTHNISEVLEDQLIELIESEIKKGVDGIIISDYAKGVITEKVAKAIITLAKEHSIPIAADVKASRAPFVVGATLISPNLKEAYEFLGLDSVKDKKEAAELAKLLHEKMKADVFLTMSAEGMYVHTSNEDPTHVPQDHVIDVFDVSGAGDTAMAVILLSRLAGAFGSEAAAMANAAGAAVVSKIGSVGLTQEELQEMLVSKPR